MKLTPLDAPAILRRYGLRPDKSLGQNFLIDEAALQRVVEASGLQPDEAALEVGPGLGGLTRQLAQRCRRVVAVELDARLLPALREVIAPFPNVEIIQGDILTLDAGRLMTNESLAGEAGYRVVANIPYYITSALIRRLLEARPPPRGLTLTLQREVAERICAAPGEMSLLALSVQVYGQPCLVARIPAGAFYPPPQVESAVIQVELFPEPRLVAEHLPLFFRLAKAGFSQKRKTLRNALAGGLGWKPQQSEALLLSADIDPQRRAETLSLEEWQRLVLAYERSSATAPEDPS
ncbi:MAG: 16S rRNA (adenine(1518)-N(6)/adenine(1519)-N(6))-dimethyltransferase RsmA [Anaerolineales bacterium]|nr:16S rRNA (adenine(1518)-N(6)/adenine(1519)-N(6))-dimethyltransferase RsmA [Anaerolineales bacterium]